MAASARRGGAPVSVQLTSIVPVRVFNPQGDYFDTEVDIDAPLRAMQLAIEDYFKIKPEVQLLLHNRQQIHAEGSLRDNGCLLLKGDPYIKIVCTIKRGPVLNLLCEVGPLTYVVACHESSTVWEVKRMLCDEMAQRQQQRVGSEGPSVGAARWLNCGPERLRLLWRYMELNDKATLHYYRVPTNAVFHVMHRKRAVAAPSAAAAATTINTPRAVQSQRSTALPPTVWWQRPPPPPTRPSPPLASAAPSHSPEDYNDALENMTTRRAAPPPDVVMTPVAPPSVSYAPPPPSCYAGLSPSAAASPQQPQQYYDPVTNSETVHLALRVRALEEQLRALWQALQEQRQLGEYQRGGLTDTHQRILELQEQMEHVLWLQQETARLIPT
jgi:hypothetical protein